MILLMVLFLSTTFRETTSTMSELEKRFTALKFGSSINDYIFYQPDMTELAEKLSVCSWVRKLVSGNNRSWLSYSADGVDNEILMSDTGTYNYMFGDSYSIQSSYTSKTSFGSWHHVCVTWQFATRERLVYVNGEQISNPTTPSGRRLAVGGCLLIGHDQDPACTASADTAEPFGGELYKLNFYSEVLNSTSIQQLSEDRCADAEVEFDSIRVIKWEEILLQTRSGDVQNIGAGCIANKFIANLEYARQKNNELKEENSELKEENSELKEDIEEASIRINRTSTRLETTQLKLRKTRKQLNSTKDLLEATRRNLTLTEADLANKTTMLTETQEELEDALNKAKCELNSTVTSTWDMLYSPDIFNEILTLEKLAYFKTKIEKLSCFVGVRMTDTVIRFFKLYHGFGQDACEDYED